MSTASYGLWMCYGDLLPVPFLRRCYGCAMAICPSLGLARAKPSAGGAGGVDRARESTRCTNRLRARTTRAVAESAYMMRTCSKCWSEAFDAQQSASSLSFRCVRMSV